MKGLLCILLLNPFLSFAQIGNITTIAGNGTSGTGSDNIPATSSALSPGGIAFDSKGNLYIVGGNLTNVVRKVNVYGIITTFAGTGVAGFFGDNGPATNAQLNYPTYVAVDRHDNIYISDANNKRIRKIDTNGMITTFAGNGIGTYNGDNIPATSASIFTPQGINFDKHGSLYIADYNNHRIRKIDTFGVITTVAGNGVMGFSGDSGLATNAKLNSPLSVRPDTLGNLYIADWANNRVRKVDAASIITTITGNGIGAFNGDGIIATGAEVNGPYDIALDDSNNLYIADKGNERVRIIYNVTNLIYTVSGTGVGGYNGDGFSASLAQLWYPEALTFDKCGDLYISEAGNFRVRKIIYDTTCTLNNNSLNLNNIEYSDINISPNPVVEILSILSADKIATIDICNLTGQIMYKQSYNVKKADIDIANLQPGMYLIRVTNSLGRQVIKKIIKE